MSADIMKILTEKLTKKQIEGVTSTKRRVLIVAGAGSGKTEVMARRIAWWIGIEKVSKADIVAFTFTNRAAEEMKFRIRHWIQKITPPGQEVSLGGMYVGTIHGFCLAKIREFWPDDYHNYDILEEGSRAALILRGFYNILALESLKTSSGLGQYGTLEAFIRAYDQLHEHNLFDVQFPTGEPPFELGEAEKTWCKEAKMLTNVGDTDQSKAFAVSAARYYAYIRCRRFLDFSTSQSEFIRRLQSDGERLRTLASQNTHLVVDEVQDINPVQADLIRFLTKDSGKLTAVGDHRQSIYGFRGAKVDIIAGLWEEFQKSSDGKVVDLEENFRSTPRIIDLANRWSKTIGKLRSMKTTPMKHGNPGRHDHHPSHVALIDFDTRAHEAAWIAEAIRILVPTEIAGAMHDKKDGSHRGISLSDVAVLVRSTTNVRDYMQALEALGIPCVVRAGPDLFSQPEILLFVAALAITAGCGDFVGSPYSKKSLPNRIQSVLRCGPSPELVFREAAKALRRTGLSFDREVEDRVIQAARSIRERSAENRSLTPSQVSVFRTAKLRDFLTSKNKLRRIFPQQIFHMLLSEAEVRNWDTGEGRGQAALFHLGALSSLVTGMETPGWTSVDDYQWQMIGLCQFGAEEGRTEEQPLMVRPEAVSISTIHGAKGLEFAAVFLADVNASRFPSSKASQKPKLPISGKILKKIDIDSLHDNPNHDGERRLLYVALTRAERFLFITHSGEKTSKFIKELKPLVRDSGGSVTNNSEGLLRELKYAPKEHLRDIRLATTFSDLRYYFECPHDFYLRKVMGFAPTIDQAFGYGRGVHNLMRAIHSDPEKWAALAENESALNKELFKLIQKGLFYLRYTTGAPADNMRAKGVRIAEAYIKKYAPELAHLKFEPEKEFETLIEYEDGSGGAIVSGAIDIVRQDDPPRVTLIDFKSGDPESDMHMKLDESLMQLQVGMYALAAKKELEYQPEKGLVRYLDSEDPKKSELKIPLDGDSLKAAQKIVSDAVKQIRDRKFTFGPKIKDPMESRCIDCDFCGFCGFNETRDIRK